jgi:hypothetical protein
MSDLEIKRAKLGSLKPLQRNPNRIPGHVRPSDYRFVHFFSLSTFYLIIAHYTIYAQFLCI